MPATATPSTEPITSCPAWPTAVLCGNDGIAAYGMLVEFSSTSANPPRPEPNTRAIRGRNAVRERINSAAARARANWSGSLKRRSAAVSFAEFFQISLGFEGGHAASPRRGYRLAVAAVGDITGDENSGDARRDVSIA